VSGYRFFLEPTATYRTRSGLWVPTVTGGAGGDGVLTLVIVHAKAYKVEIDAYGVEEVSPELFRTRRFVLVNLTDPDQQEAYEVVGGAVRKCTCEAGRKGFKRASCKHVDALAHLVQAGKLPAKPLAQLQGA
jgi:hypothetical protein